MGDAGGRGGAELPESLSSAGRGRFAGNIAPMAKRVVVMQSNYVPWRGYFDLFAHADTVVLFDSVQSTKNDWRNRNRIKTANGAQWLTIPIRHSNALRLREVEIATRGWHLKHFRTLSQAYARAPHAAALLPAIEAWFHEAGSCNLLTDANRVFLRAACDLLRIDTPLIDVDTVLSHEEHDRLDPSRRLAEICTRIGASVYVTAPAARAYLDEAAFARVGVAVQWFDYDGYPDYPQLHGGFDPAVSILDLLLMTGADARRYAIRDHTPSVAGRY